MKQAKWTWADGERQLREGPVPNGPWARCLAVSRLGSVASTAAELSVWVQVRGHAWIEAKEGRFYLRPGDWVAFAKDSHPVVQADASGLCLGLSIAEDAVKAMAQFSEFGLYVGRGRLALPELRNNVKLWHRLARSLALPQSARMDANLRSLMLNLEGMQRDYRTALQRCPGPSHGRKRQVFERMQRARLYMEGHCDRMVRVGELAERTQFSVWYFSKVFHRLYGQSPQSASAVLRLEHAANLLVSTPMTIGEVGVASGFDNNCSFARSFRARFGMTASDFRSARQPRLISQTCSTSRANHIADVRESLGYTGENAASRSNSNVTGRLTRP